MTTYKLTIYDNACGHAVHNQMIDQEKAKLVKDLPRMAGIPTWSFELTTIENGVEVSKVEYKD